MSVSRASVVDAVAVVVGVAVAEALPLDGLDDEVASLGAPVGEPSVEEGEEFGFPASQCLGEPVAFGDVVDADPVVPVAERPVGVRAHVASVEVAQHLLEGPGALELVGEIRCERHREAILGPGAEMLTRPHEIPPHRVERIAGAATMAGQGLLQTAAHLGERLGREPFDVEPVRDPDRMGGRGP